VASRLAVDRAQWLGFRWQRHGLGGHLSDAALDDLLLLGVRAGRHGGAHQSLLQRAATIGSTRVVDSISPDGPLVSLWSVRGAPHAHRLTQLALVRDALAPQEADEGGAAYVEAVAEVAAALAAVVTAPISKADASTAVTDRVSPALVGWCERCGAHHVGDGLFRAAGRQALVVLGPEEQRATMLHPTPEHPPSTVDHPRLELLLAYLRVNGPSSRTVFRDWMEAGTRATAEVWARAGEMARVRVDDRRLDLPEALVDELRTAPEPDGVALVPPDDPYLRQVDKSLLVPDGRRRREVWRPLSGPGALLVDGEVAGTWRYRRTSRELTVTAFDRLPATRRARVEASARLVTRATGDEEPTLSWD
jgi:hypothetical protein